MKTLVIILLIIMGSFLEAEARIALTGLAELQLEKYRETGTEIIEAEQMLKRYEIGLTQSGNIMGRGGDWRWGLRYQQMESESDQDGRVTGDIDINFHPVDMPLRLRAYYRDINPLIPLSHRSVGSMASIAPLLVDSFASGGTGTKDYGVYAEYEFKETNSGKERLLYLLEHREELRKELERSRNGGLQPTERPIKVYLDYRGTDTDRPGIEERTEDLKLSLNKDKIWLNSSFYKYDNRLGAGNYLIEEYQAGNATRDGRREWFYVSNWTLLSIDGTYRRRDSLDVARDAKTYNLNLFANAFRSWWEATFYGNYSQTLDYEGYRGSRSTSLPLYLTIIPNSDNRINWKNSYRQETAWVMDTPRAPQESYTYQEYEDFKAGKPWPGYTTLDRQEVVSDITNTTRIFSESTFTQRFTLAKEDGVGVEDITSRTLNLGLNSNPSRPYGYGLGYSYGTLDGDSSKRQDETVSADGRYAITQRISLSGSYSVTNATEDLGQEGDTRTRSDYANLGLNLYLHRLVSIDLRASRNSNTGNNQSNQTMTYAGNIRLSGAWLKINSDNRYLKQAADGFNGYVVDQNIFASSNLMEIRLNRSLASRTKFDYSQESDGLREQTTRIRSVEEGLEYNRFTKGYNMRTLLRAAGSGNYSESESEGGKRLARGLALGIDYYPLRFMSLGGAGRYSVDSVGVIIQAANAYVAFPLPKLNITASYGYEARVGAKEDYVANKVSVKVSKIF